jgi:dihydroorotate dehydrogenase (NAD+) catalytic subunit
MNSSGIFNMTPDLSTKIDSIEMKNPVMVASGTFGYGEEFHDSIYDISRLGAVVTKGISLAPREGNPVPRVIETSSGMLNAIGLANVGLDVFISEKLPFLTKAGATVVVNIFGSRVEDYAEVAAGLNSAEGIAGIELNISCPNVSAGGVQFGTDPKLAAEVTRAVRDSFSRTLIVKLSPQASDIAEMGSACVGAGADALSLINTIPAMAVDISKKKPILTNVTGGLSGPAIKPVALKAVYDVARAVDVPIIGMGGIMGVDDVIEFLLVGASAVQIGTANFVNPNVAMEIIDGLGSYCTENGLTSIGEIVGAIEV